MIRSDSGQVFWRTTARLALVSVTWLCTCLASDQAGTAYGQPSPSEIVVAAGDRAAGRLGTFSGRGGSARWRTVTPEPAKEGKPRFYEITYNQGSGGFCGWYVDCLRRPIDATSLSVLRFWICGGAGGEKVRLGLKDANMDPDREAILVDLPPLTRQWRNVEVSLASFRGLRKDRIASVVLMPTSPRAGTFYVAGIRLTAASPSPKSSVVSPKASKSAPNVSGATPKTSESTPKSTPKVRILSISASQGMIRGKAENLPGPTDQFCIAVFVKSDIYYLHPVLGSTASIAQDGSWQIRHVIRGGEKELAAVLMRRPFDPPDQARSLETFKPLAIATVPYHREFRQQPASQAPRERPSQVPSAEQAEGKPRAEGSVKVEILRLSASKGVIRGKVERLPGPVEQYGVVCLMKTDVFYPHPRLDSSASINEDGSWEIPLQVRGGEREVAAVVLKRPFSVPDSVRSLDLLQPLARAVVPYEAEYDATPRMLEWGGRSWLVKGAAKAKQGPGPNLWSRNEKAIWVDDAGLHLTISQRNGVWQCTEVSSLESLGWGDYEWAVDLPRRMPPEVVFALFVYQDDRHEIEAIELSQWGDADKPNAQYCLQPSPSTKDGSLHRFNVTSQTITVRLSWRRDKARFACWEGQDTTSRPVADWTYTGPKLFKPGGEHVHINFWLMGGRPPASQQPQEVVIKSFSFRPAANDSEAANTSD
jgi:hypothetical protein